MCVMDIMCAFQPAPTTNMGVVGTHVKVPSAPFSCGLFACTRTLHPDSLVTNSPLCCRPLDVSAWWAGSLDVGLEIIASCIERWWPPVVAPVSVSARRARVGSSPTSSKAIFVHPLPLFPSQPSHARTHTRTTHPRVHTRTHACARTCVRALRVIGVF
jgi:hypothetical protein